ncbi:MAG: arginine repressor [Clostridia bacterium]|jgi:transcriptional regulator of arginine metabolism|nr:arginine repressor [Clostridia bacterium]
MKKKRHKLILELIEKYEIGTQEDLLQMLRERGCDVTQATVSRDVKELRLLKTLGANGVYKYSVEKAVDNSYPGMFDALFQSAMTKVDYAGNICVIKCSPGLAGAACATIDAMNVHEVVGTIAGDDTIFMLCRTPDEARGVAEALNRMIGR